MSEIAQGMVHFIGAGPGDPELLTLRGARLIAEASLVLYAGSLVPRAVVAHAAPQARVEDSAPLTLEQTHALMRETAQAGGDVARVHTGDPGLYGAVMEQARLLDDDSIRWDITPGVTSASAAIAAAGTSFTWPGVTQSVVLTRAGGKTPMPERERIRAFAATGASVAVYLSASLVQQVADEFAAGGYAPHTPVLIAYRAGWPEERYVWSDVAHMVDAARAEGFTRQTLFIAIPGAAIAGQAGDAQPARSHLYHPDHPHGFRS